MENLGLNPLILCKFMGKIEILSTRILLCRKFSVSLEKLQLSDPPTFSIHDAAAFITTSRSIYS